MNNPIRFIDPDGMNVDWWVDEKTGGLTHTPKTNNKPESTEGNKDVQYLGPDGMFGENGSSIENSDCESGTETNLSPEDSKALAESSGYEVVPVEETTTSDTKSTTYPTGKHSVTIETGTVQVNEDKVTYIPTGNEEVKRTTIAYEEQTKLK
jgi:hypothetical protein